MSRIEACFTRLRDKKHKALIAYVTAGDPHPSITVPLMHAMVGAGADVIELGVPFSDPMADGPVIQRASERALKHHVNLHRVLEMVTEFRKSDRNTPVVLMGYLNPVEVMGYANFARDAGKAGVDGVLTVDLPPEEAAELIAALRQHEIDTIFLVAPTTPEARIKTICAAARGFIYYVSLKGVTGASNLDPAAVADKLQQLRAATTLPVGVGFGIRDAQTAAAVSRIADAVVVGSAVVRKIEEAGAWDAMKAVQGLLREMRAAMDREQE
jgi:tryptophan synthase alpha chain